MSDSDLILRRADEADLDAIVELASLSLGWAPGEPHAELFRWKHMDNPFGPSPMWVAESGGRLAGFRALMRWELLDESGRTWRAVRAVDTATHPDFQRRGIFSKLTLGAVREMADEGVDIVFNTPNAQSRPGYLKMGWIDVGRLPVTFRPTSLGALVRIARARTAAQKWSEPSPVGVCATEALADSGVEELLAGQPPPTGLVTPLSVDYLRWRYGLEPLHYRAWAPDGPGKAMVLFRVRRRGEARECSVGTVLVPGANKRAARRLLSGLAKAVDADYLLCMGVRFLPMPRQGPRLTARKVTSAPNANIGQWHFQLGDVEPF